MNEELKLSIEKLVYGGDGLAHADGNTVFVPYVLPGEKVRAASKSRIPWSVARSVNRLSTADEWKRGSRRFMR